ncbi:MAG: hypothetical protein GY934_19360 [Gammaproteobacteria bacterium]|nr:hypothetical protein [Gammaproteobacteria bacterium]
MQKSVSLLHIQPERSHILITFIFLTHGAALLALTALWDFPLLAISLMVLTVLSGITVWQHYVYSSGGSAISQANRDGKGNWILMDRSGQTQPAELCSAMVTRPLIILSFARQQGRNIHLVLPSDSLSRSQHRRLRSRLREPVHLSH